MIDWRPECTKQSWGTDAGAFTGGPTKIVMHSTETGSWPSYDSGLKAPHETWKWNHTTKKFDKRQHVPHTLACRALKNLDGGVQTNRDGAHQVELIGSCSKTWATKYGYDYLPGMGDVFLRELGLEIRELAKDIGLTNLTVPTQWIEYVGGPDLGQRFSQSKWDGFAGICGHEHVPENDHQDPGSLNIPRAMTLSLQEDDMTPDELMDFDTVPSPMLGPDNPTATVRGALALTMQWALAGRNAAQAAARDSAAGLEIITKYVSTPGDTLTEAEIEAAAERGAQKAIDAEITGATVQFNVTQPTP